MKILVINGSPKGNNSITLQTLLFLEKLFIEHQFTFLNVGQKIKHYEKKFDEIKEELENTDIIIFSYPVYTFLVPYQLYRFIELLKENNVNIKNKFATQVSTSKHFYDITAHKFVEEYPQCYSSDTATFLLKRIEYGCEGKGYESRILNEQRIDTEGCMKMSKLTRALMDAEDYAYNHQKRQENFAYAHQLLGGINQINPTRYMDEETVPMVYPLVVEDDGLIQKLFTAKHFQGHWWSYICEEQPKNSFEHWISRYVIPITIDQRYGKEELDYLVNVIKE